MSILIIGAAGAIGSYLTRQFARGGHMVFASDIWRGLEDSQTEWFMRNIPGHCVAFIPPVGDGVILGTGDPIAARHEIDLCINASGNANTTADLDALFRANCVIPGIVARDCDRANVPLVHLSSAAVYGLSNGEAWAEGDILDPISSYGRSKRYGETQLELETRRTPCLNLRLFNVYGINEHHKLRATQDSPPNRLASYYRLSGGDEGIFLGALKSGREVKRDFVSVRSVYRVIEAWLRLVAGGDVPNDELLTLNVGCGEATSFATMFELTHSALGREGSVLVNRRIIEPRPGYQPFSLANVERLTNRALPVPLPPAAELALWAAAWLETNPEDLFGRIWVGAPAALRNARAAAPAPTQH